MENDENQDALTGIGDQICKRISAYMCCGRSGRVVLEMWQL